MNTGLGMHGTPPGYLFRLTARGLCCGPVAARLAVSEASMCGPDRGVAGRGRPGSQRITPSAAAPAPNALRGGKRPEKLLARGGTRTPTCVGAYPGRLEEGTRHGLSDQRIRDRPQRACRCDGQRPVVATRQAGGFLAGPRPARPGRDGLRRRDVVVGPARTRIAALPPAARAGGQPAAGPRRGCGATGAHSGRARAGLTSLRPGYPGSAVARPGSCRPPGVHRQQHASRRLSRYR